MTDKISDIAAWANGDVPEIIEATKESLIAYSRQGFGQGVLVLYKEHLDALRKGKAIAYADSEYTTVIIFVPESVADKKTAKPNHESS